jgi:flagellar biosynthesis GTPase FlhF
MRAALVALLMCGCQVSAMTPGIAAPSAEPAATDEEAEYKKSEAERKKHDEETVKKKAEEDAQNEAESAKIIAEREAAEKAKAEAKASAAKAHADSCKSSFPARLAAMRAAVKKRPKECAWLETHCEWKDVTVVKKTSDGGKAWTESDLVCKGPNRPASLGSPKAWWDANSERCGPLATKEDGNCGDVDPIDLGRATDEDVASFKG